MKLRWARVASIALCPPNALAVASDLPLAADLIRLVRRMAIATAIATAALLIWRIVVGTPPQRRALAIGTPIALVFTLSQIMYQLLGFVDPEATTRAWFQWALAGSRSLIWYGFVFALIAAQLFAGRVLHKLVTRSLHRPSQPDLEAMMREELSDPELTLRFLDPAGESEADGRPMRRANRGVAARSRSLGAATAAHWPRSTTTRNWPTTRNCSAPAPP